MKFKHMKFLNKVVNVIDDKLQIDLGNGVIKPIPEGNYCVSKKFDGVLMAIKDGELLSSSLKPIKNKQLWNYFKEVIQICKDKNLILFGELYSHDINFQEIISVVMTHDKEVPENFKFHCFDCIKEEQYDMSFINRLKHIPQHETIIYVDQPVINSKEPYKFQDLFKSYLADNYEGLIIKNADKGFKCGRTTLNEGIGFKFKNYETEDAQIIDVIQATIARVGSEKKINEEGRSVTSKKKDDRVLINKASAFLVIWNNIEFKVTIAEDDQEKERIWNMREEFRTGKHKVEFKAMFTTGVKNAPRHPTSLRLRMFNDEE